MAKILVVDDAPFFRMMLKDVLEKGGHEVLFAEDGDQAVSEAKTHAENLDLIILDMILPKKTGLEVLMDLSELSIKTLCVTGNDMVGELDELRELGAADVINKSAPVEEIVYRINQLLFPGEQKESKRGNQRILVNLQILYRHGKESFTSSTFTLSDQGVFIQSTQPLPIGTEVGLSFYLPMGKDAGKEIDCKGRIVWVETEATKPGTVKGMGIAFVDISPFDRQMVSDFVQTICHKSQGTTH